MKSINPYLNFNGNCEDAFEFYKSVFGGEYQSFSRFGEIPASEDFAVPEDEKELIMHVSLPLGDQVLMGSDTSKYSGATVFGTNISISIDTDSKADADRMFEALSEGGKVTMPIGDMFWGSYFGMCTDQHGVQWMVSFGEAKE